MKDTDQLMAEMRDGLPRCWWAMYVGSKQAGFTPDQAFELVKTFAHGMAMKPTLPGHPESEDE